MREIQTKEIRTIFKPSPNAKHWIITAYRCNIPDATQHCYNGSTFFTPHYQCKDCDRLLARIMSDGEAICIESISDDNA